MPAAIGVAIIAELAGVSAETAAGLTILGVSASNIVGYGVISAALIGAQFAASALQPQQKRADQQLTIRQAIPARTKGHGRDKLGGAIVFYDTRDSLLFRAVVHLADRVYIRQYWIGDVPITLTSQTGGSVADSPYKGAVNLEVYTGSPDQIASTALASGFPYWSANARLRGLTYTIASFAPVKHGDLIFPEGANDIRIVADMGLCFDPRDASQSAGSPATWKWSDNAAIVLLAYLHDDSGYGIPLTQFDLDAFTALANVCDEAIPLQPRSGTTNSAGVVVGAVPAGTTEPRYRSWGTYSLTEERSQVLARYLAACDAELDQDGQGRVTVRGGRWQPPTVTITEGMVLGWDSFEEGSEAYATFNRIKVTFKGGPDYDYQPLEGDPWNDLAGQAQIGVVETEKDFGRAPSHSQARRLAKIAMAKGAPQFRFTGLRLTPAGLRAYGEPTVTLILPSLGISGTFALSRGQLTGPDLLSPVFDLYSLDASAYAWSTTEEGNPPPLPNADAVPGPPLPSNVSYAITRTTVNGQVTGLSATFSADPVPGYGNLVLVGRYRSQGDAAWADMDSVNGAPVAQPLNDGQAYEAEVAWVSGASLGDYTAPPLAFTASADTTAPGPVTGFVENDGAGQFSYAFTAPNSANFGSAVAYLGTSATFVQATKLRTFNGAASQSFDKTETGQTPGTYYLWIRALNRSGLGDASSTAGPKTVTVS